VSTPATFAPDHVEHEALLQCLLRAVESSVVTVAGVSIRYTVSGGIARMDASAPGSDALMKRTDQALYLAKGRGRNRVECWAAA